MLAIEDEIQRLRSLRAIRSSLLRLKWLAAAVRLEIAMRRHMRALKYGYNPDQPRVPRGNPGGGEWTSEGGGNDRRVRLAGDIPTGDSPEPPKERPPTSGQRTAALKLAARLLGPATTVAEIAKFGAWLQTYSPLIESYSDPPKTLEELQRDVSKPESGYDIHHIVERNQEGHFAREAIDSPENLVRIPRLKHQEINAWYQTKNPIYGGISPRQYLDGRNWDVQRSVGLDALRSAGVLKP